MSMQALSFNKRVKVHWKSGHMCVAGNKAADTQAKLSVCISLHHEERVLISVSYAVRGDIEIEIMACAK